MPFDYTLDFSQIDFRQNPELYRIGRGEQGVLLVQPYKSEILPYWRFKTPEIARESSQKIYALFLQYLENNDFVGADMARKFLQMGFTRARRYANHKSGQKYTSGGEKDSKIGEGDQLQTAKIYPYSSGSKNKENPILPQEKDALTSQKALSAETFKEKWYAAKNHPEYQKLAKEHMKKYGK